MSLRNKLYWVAILYFAEGMPFGIVYDLLPVYFRVHGISLTEIGALSLLGMPWTFKVLWAPLVDRYGARRTWMVACLSAMAIVLYLVPLFPAGDMGPMLWTLLLILTMASATQDIAIDAYTIEMMGPREEGPANGVRVSAYRVALIAVGGGLLLLVPWMGWIGVFHAAAGVAVVLAIVLWRAPRVRVEANDAAWRDWLGEVLAWFARPSALVVFIFVLTFKLGDVSMGPMVKPFWIDSGLSVVEVGLVSNTVGIGLSVAGALVGGWLTSRWGIFAALWTLGLAQAVSNLGYAAAAWWELGRMGVYGASVIESFTGGLGTAAFLAFLMHICDKRHAAVEYAFLSAVFGFTRSVAGAASGWATTQLGYASYFGLTFLLALPAFVLLPWVRGWIREEGAAPRR